MIVLSHCFKHFVCTSLGCLTFILVSIYPSHSQVYFPDKEWRRGQASDHGINGDQLSEFVRLLREGEIQRPISSLVIIKDGYLVTEEYFGNYTGTSAHTLQSVTKSISSTLVGTAIQCGYIDGMDEKVIDFFPEYDQIKNLNEDKRAMDLHHALTMRTGQAWTGERHLGALNRHSGDKMKYVLDYEMSDPPGKKWFYNSGIAVLLGGLLENATGFSTAEFAQNFLFEPIGIKSARWSWSHRGIPHTGGGLFLSPLDMARIGYLYLRNGRWGDRQILPEWWVTEATKRHVPFTENIEGVSRISYGYMWWLLSLEKDDTVVEEAEVFMAYGHWGQFIFVIPSFDMVVIFTNDRSASYPEETKPISLMYEYVIPAIQKKNSNR